MTFRETLVLMPSMPCGFAEAAGKSSAAAAGAKSIQNSLQGHFAAKVGHAYGLTTDQMVHIATDQEASLLYKDGRAIIKAPDNVVSNFYHNDPVILAKWRTASRILRTSDSPPPPEPEPPTPPTP